MSVSDVVLMFVLGVALSKTVPQLQHKASSGMIATFNAWLLILLVAEKITLLLLPTTVMIFNQVQEKLSRRPRLLQCVAFRVQPFT